MRRVRKPRGPNRHQIRKAMEIDAALTVLCSVAEPGQTMTRDEIAEVCNCGKTTILNIERSALDKLRARMHRADYLD